MEYILFKTHQDIYIFILILCWVDTSNTFKLVHLKFHSVFIGI